MEFLVFLIVLGIVSFIGIVWTEIGIRRDERNGLHKPLPQS